MFLTRKVSRKNRIGEAIRDPSEHNLAVNALDLLFEDKAFVTLARSDPDAAKHVIKDAFYSTNTPLHSLCQELVHSLYKVILRRDADCIGLSDYTQDMNRRGLLAGVPHVVQQLMASDEYGLLCDLDISHRELKKDVKQIYGPVKNLISPGTICFSSWLMQQCGCKRWSGPFDWILVA